MFIFLSSRVTAAHLAIAAVAPLVLCMHFGSSASAATVVWLAAIASVWAFMAPVASEREHASEARMRVLEATLADPAVWVLALVVVYAAVIAFNGGVALVYDDNTLSWALSSPGFPALPGGVSGVGGIHFAAALLVFVLYPALGNSLDGINAVDFSIGTSLVVATDVLIGDLLFGIAIGGRAVACGLWALIAFVALAMAQRTGSRPREFLATLGFVGCLLALLVTRNPVAVAVFGSALAISIPVAAAVSFLKSGWLGMARVIVMSLASIAAAIALFLWLYGNWSSLIPVWFRPSDGTLASLAKTVWALNPWAGTGLGAFPAAAKLAAAPEDWEVLGAVPDFYRSGWLAFFAERGMIGVMAAVVMVGAIAVTWFRRVRLRGFKFFTVALPLLPLATAAFVISMVFDGSGLRADAFVAFGVALALSVNGGI